MMSFSCDFTYNMEQVKQLSGFEHAGILEKAHSYYPVLQQLISNISYRTEHCLIEGEVILPEHVFKLAKDYDIKACFIGVSDTSTEKIIEHGGYFNWPKYKLENNLQHEVLDLAERTIARSKIIEEECKKFNQPYFDLRGDYAKQQAAALDFLLG